MKIKVLLLVLVTAMMPTLARATAGQAWVGASGNDSNTCSNRATPCLTLGGAYAQVDAGSQITCLDTAWKFQSTTFTITHSIVIDCEGTSTILSSNGTTLITVNAGPTDVVIVRGIDFEGFMLSGFTRGVGGINFIGGGALHVENCTFRNFTASGVRFSPSSAGKLFVSNSVFQHNGDASSGGGIVIQPSGAGTAVGVLNQVRLENNTFGIAFDGTGSTNGINMTITDSLIGGNTHDGIIATTPSNGAPIGVMVTNTKSVNNAFGIRSLGPNVTVRVKNSDVIGNGAGLSFGSAGALLTTGNNMVRANAVDGAFSGPVALQ